jgi:ubiquitin-conjugating enzyme E2 I
VKQILLGIQDLLDSPNGSDPAQRDAAVLFKQDVSAYKQRVKALAKAYAEEHNAE